MLETKPDTLEIKKYFEDWFKISAVEDLTKILVWEITKRRVQYHAALGLPHNLKILQCPLP